MAEKGKRIMRENIKNISQDSFEILEFVGDVAIYATFSGYHNPLAATITWSAGGDPVMIALNVVKYDENTVFTPKGQKNKFTEEEGLLHREFFTIAQVISVEGEEHTSEAYLRIMEVIESLRNGTLDYSIAPVVLDPMEEMFNLV